MSSSSSGKRPSDAEWLKHKLTIERMFVEEKKSLVETRQRLENDGFLVTKAQLEYKLKLWGFRRRIPKTKSDAVWQFIGRRVQRRKQQGKETEVMLGKEIVDAAKVCKEIRRHQETTVARFSHASPMTPEGLEISLHTPASLPMRFLWPTGLPWSTFQDSFPIFFAVPDWLKSMDNGSKDLRCRRYPSFTRILRLIAPQHAAGYSVTQLAAEIGSIMPETHEHDLFGQASRLLQGTADERYSEYFKIIWYMISNNLLLNDKMNGTYVDPILGRSQFMEWEDITEMLETLGIMKAPLQLGSIPDVTMNAIMEKLFQNALLNIDWESLNQSLEESSDGRIINWLLQSGQNPNVRIQYHLNDDDDYGYKDDYYEDDDEDDAHDDDVHDDIFMGTPLQMAAQKGSLQLMSRLLDHGACPNLTYELWDESSGCETLKGIHPLLETTRQYIAFDEDRLGMIERLLGLTSDVHMGPMIRMMMNRRYYVPELMEVLTRTGVDIFQSVKATTDDAWFIDTFSIVGFTAKYKCKPKELHPFFRLLEKAGIQHRSQIPEVVDTTSIVLLAAAEGNTAFLEDLHSYGIDTTATGNLGSSAVHVAACYGHFETCKKLVLEHHAPVNSFDSNKRIPSPLHFAAAGRNLGIVRLFHQSNIDVNEVFEDQQGEWSVIMHWTGKRKSWLKRSFTAVDVALNLSSDDITRYLLENGAKAPPWGAYYVTYFRIDDTAQELAKLAVKTGADPSWGVYKPIPPRPHSISSQVRYALSYGNTELAQELILDTHEDDPWDDANMSILEAAIITCHEQTVEKIFAQDPAAYDPGALCAKVLFSPSSRDSITVHRLLSNRPRSERTLPLEALAIGLAAWSGQTEVLKLLLAEFDQLVLTEAPEVLRCGLPRFSTDEFAKDGLPFWHRPDLCQTISPTVFALESREALSLMLKHGYNPDRFTMRAAIHQSDLEILKMLAMSPRLSNCPGHIQGPLSYAVMYKHYDTVRVLLENGEDVDEDNYHVSSGIWDNARNPLQSAVEKGDLYLIDLLLKSGADVNAPAAKYNGATALQLAAITGKLGILRTLIEHGADINAPGAKSGGRTTLEGAAEHGRIDVIQYLLSIGARTTDRDRLQYLRAIRYAQIEAHEVAANLIKGHREWTTDDHCLWTALKGLHRGELESFKETTQEIPSSSDAMGDNIALKNSEVEQVSTTNGSEHFVSMEDVCNFTEGMYPSDDLQYLVTRTNDPMVFMMGGM
ncbi:Ankyrin-1 [Colletotrichum siamense]|nr:Ankyrin-1 [Colletotrichum siamense]